MLMDGRCQGENLCKKRNHSFQEETMPVPLPFKLEGPRKSNLLTVLCQWEVLNKEKKVGGMREGWETSGPHRKTSKSTFQTKGPKAVEVYLNWPTSPVLELVYLLADLSFHSLNLVSVGLGLFYNFS